MLNRYIFKCIQGTYNRYKNIKWYPYYIGWEILSTQVRVEVLNFSIESISPCSAGCRLKIETKYFMRLIILLYTQTYMNIIILLRIVFMYYEFFFSFSFFPITVECSCVDCWWLMYWFRQSIIITCVHHSCFV